MADSIDPIRLALMPLLSAAALHVVKDHCEAVEAMAHTKRDRLLANGLRVLLDNHDKRALALKQVGDK